MTVAKEPPRPDSVARGAVLVVAMRWSDRLLGIASTMILARLLVPADFGIVAMASLVVALLDTLLDLGVNSALIHNRSADRDDFNTAWTLRLAQSAFAAGLIAVAGAPLASDYFKDPRVSHVLWVMALSVLIGGFENIGIVSFQKHMQFGREFRFFFLRRLAGFLTTIALALWLRSYWAMVLGALAGQIVGVGLSYALHEFRPRLSLSRLTAMWSFSQWILVRNLGNYGAQQVDKVLVGRRTGASSLGAYALADEIAAMPTGEVLAPLGRVIFPSFVRVADNPQRLRKAFALALGLQALLALPAGAGLAMVADSAVPLLLGQQWLVAIPLVQTLALMSVAGALAHSSAYLLLALGKVRLQAVHGWAQFASLVLLLAVVFPNTDVEGIAQVRLGVSVAAMLLLLAMVLRALPVLRVQDLVISAWRPLLATVVMVGALSCLPSSTELPHAIRLIMQVIVGGSVYIVAVLLLWRVSRPRRSAESYLLQTLRLNRRKQGFLRGTRFGLGRFSRSRGDRSAPTPGDAQPGATADIFAARTTAEIPVAGLALLTASGNANPECGPEWFENLQHAVFPDDSGVRYYGAQHNGECRLLLPVRLARRGRIKVIEALANFYTSLYAPPFSAACRMTDTAQVLTHASRDHAGAHEMRFAPMDPASESFRNLTSALRGSGWVPFRFFCFANWHLKLDISWGDYLRDRPGQIRNTIRRMQKKFAASGGTLEIVSAREHVERAVAHYVEVYSASWKNEEPYPRFIPGLIGFLADTGSLRLGLAYLDGRPIAAQLWAVRCGRAAIIKLAHREDCADFAPGTLLTALLMEHVIDVDRVSEVDYLIGDDPYKRNWMSHRRERWGIVAYNPRTAVGLALLVRESCLRAAKGAWRIVRGKTAPAADRH